MKKVKILLGAFVMAFLIAGCGGDREKGADRTVLRVGPQPDGSILVPTNQLLRPAGLQVVFPGRPVDIALSPDGQWLAVLNHSSVILVRVLDRAIMQTLPFRGGGSFKGIAFSADGKKIYVSQARDRILVAEMDKDHILHWGDPLIFPRPAMGGHPVPGGLTLSSDGKKLYTVLNRSNTLAVVDMADRSVKEIPVGVAPYDVLLLSDKKAYVSNWGGHHPQAGEPAYPSSGTEVSVDPETGIANSGTVSVVDLKNGKVKTDIRVGLLPTALLLSPDRSLLYVACANSDRIYLIDTRRDRVTDSISVHMEKDMPFGSSPNALAITPDGKRLFVANGADNAVCVINTGQNNSIEGFIPTAWYPGALLLDKQARFLTVVNIKGPGERNIRQDRPAYNTHSPLGSLSFIPLPDGKTLEKMTATVRANNHYDAMVKALTGKKKIRGRVPVPVLPEQRSVFEHVVYIIKENRTYDQVLGDMPQGNGDTALVMFGREVSPNHHALAEQFVLLDNFYCSGVLSADGHQWTDEAYVTDYLEKSFGDFPRSYPYDGDDPLAYSPAGFLWDNALQHGLTFRNYGEFVGARIEPDGTFKEIWQDYRAGTHRIKVRAKVQLPSLAPYTCPDYIGFPNRVSDQYRADVFIRELRRFEQTDSFPNLIIMLLPNDHTSGTAPGMPTPRAAVADNDLALGRIVEAISHSKFWATTCIFVTEDDPQAGLDHVDSHRTVGFVISPYTKRGEVISVYYSQISMFRTIENILGLPPLNRFDLTAAPMTDCFTDQPDLTPYKALPANIPLDRTNPSLKDLSGDALFWARKSLEQDLDDVDRIDEDTFNRILWHAVKGYDRPYPEI